MECVARNPRSHDRLLITRSRNGRKQTLGQGRCSFNDQFVLSSIDTAFRSVAFVLVYLYIRDRARREMPIEGKARVRGNARQEKGEFEGLEGTLRNASKFAPSLV